MSNILLAVVCLALGKLLQNVRQFPETSAQALNAYVIYVALPALILVQMSRLTLRTDLLIPVAAAWWVMLSSAGITWLLARRFQWPPMITGALLLVITLGNTSFIGYPLIDAHLGPQALPFAILYDQLGTFLALNTLGIAIASHYSPTTHAQAEPLWRKILKFPPFMALPVGLVLGMVDMPGIITTVLQRMADTLVPVVMVAVGLQWRLRIERKEYKVVVFALVFILLCKPLLAGLFLSVFTLDPLLVKTTLLEAAMPAMISTGALALSYQLAPRLVSTIIGYSLILSFVTVWLWRLAIDLVVG